MTEQKNIQTTFWGKLAEATETALNVGKTPYAIIDLDGTLVDYSMRTSKLFEKALDIIQPSKDIADLIRSIKPTDYSYFPGDDFVRIGISDKQTVEKLVAYWDEYYFSNHYLEHDRPRPGAYEFILNLLKLNINIIYLTSRDYENMGEGTRSWLYEHKFLKAMDCTRTLMMKTDLKLKNFQSKRANCERIAILGQPVIIIDNEPVDLEAVSNYFPEAMTVLIEGLNSGKPAVLPADVIRLNDFASLNEQFNNR
jgi:phosphoglycolate phosphatase-like HAD superfamily hydrolase